MEEGGWGDGWVKKQKGPKGFRPGDENMKKFIVFLLCLNFSKFFEVNHVCDWCRSHERCLANGFFQIFNKNKKIRLKVSWQKL